MSLVSGVERGLDREKLNYGASSRFGKMRERVLIEL
jgi:hypothetical protein